MKTYLDIETIPDQSEGALMRCIDAVEAPGNYKKPESILEWKNENALTIGAEQWKQTALDPMCGQILVICWATEENAVLNVRRGPQDSEKAMLLDFCSQADDSFTDSFGNFRIPRFIGWNIADFDLRYLAIRCAVHGITPPFRLPVNEKYDGAKVCDLMRIWSGFKGFKKQAAVARAMGIPVENQTDGKDLWDLVKKEGAEAALLKCISDVEVLRQIHRRMAPIFGC